MMRNSKAEMTEVLKKYIFFFLKSCSKKKVTSSKTETIPAGISIRPERKNPIIFFSDNSVENRESAQYVRFMTTLKHLNSNDW